jgi:hypothetical protein
VLYYDFDHKYIDNLVLQLFEEKEKSEAIIRKTDKTITKRIKTKRRNNYLQMNIQKTKD